MDEQQPFVEYVLTRPDGFFILIKQVGETSWRWAVAILDDPKTGKLREEYSGLLSNGDLEEAIAKADEALARLPLPDDQLVPGKKKDLDESQEEEDRLMGKQHILEATLKAYFRTRQPVTSIQVTAWQDIWGSSRSVLRVLNSLVEEDGLIIRVGSRYAPSPQLLQSRRQS